VFYPTTGLAMAVVHPQIGGLQSEGQEQILEQELQQE